MESATDSSVLDCPTVSIGNGRRIHGAPLDDQGMAMDSLLEIEIDHKEARIIAKIVKMGKIGNIRNVFGLDSNREKSVSSPPQKCCIATKTACHEDRTPSRSGAQTKQRTSETKQRACVGIVVSICPNHRKT